MNVRNITKRVIKSTALSGSVIAVFATTPLAFAHGSSHHNGGRGSLDKMASSQRVSKHKSNNGSYKQKQHQKTCAEQQASANQRAASTKDRDQKKLNGLNIVLSGTQAYVASGGVTVENYDGLNATASSDQATATNAVNAIAAPQLDCEADNAGDANKAAISSFNSSLKAADHALATYRHDVFNLFQKAVNS